MLRKAKRSIKILTKRVVILLVMLMMIFPFSLLKVLADAVPVEEVGSNLVENTLTAEMRIPQNNSSVVSGTSSIIQLLSEIMAPVYQLSTPGSNLSYDIYRYLMKHTENELGIDKDFFRRLKRKVNAPTVDIIFAPTNPKVGEKVTAIAVPHNFRNSKEKLYFTWYIVHDGEKDVTAGRDEAMGIVARGGYDPALFGEPKSDDGDRDAYNASFGGDDGVGKKHGRAADEDCKECDCLHNMTMFAGMSGRGCFDDKGGLLYSKDEEFDEATEDRGLESAKWGKGAVNSEWISRCYRHNFGKQSQDGSELSGRDMIIACHHAFNAGLGTDDHSFSSGEEEVWKTNPENPDTDGDGVVDEADLVGLGQDEFTWTYRKGDKVSVAVEGMSNIIINEGSTDRLRYGPKNDDWNNKTEQEKDLSPTASPETWYYDARQKCEDAKNDCLASTGNSLMYTPVADRLPSDGECVQIYSDCMKQLWEHEKKDKNDEDAFGDMTGYYKIMWAAPGICAKESMDSAENDWCDTDDDLGFQYLKLYDPVEQGRQPLEVSVSVSPKNPQYFIADEENNICGSNSFCYLHGDGTDMIVASADVISKDNLNPDYLYYKWSIWQCQPDDFTECEDVTNTVTFKSQKEGLGIRDIGFYPNQFTLNGERTLLKIAVIVKRHKNSTMSSPGINKIYTGHIADNESLENYNSEDQYPNKYAYSADKLVEVVKNKLKIKLSEASPDGGGGWQKFKGICDGSQKKVYLNLCPVYPYQVLMAELEGDATGIIWKLNGKIIRPKVGSTVNQDTDSRTIFFPITGQEGDLMTITAVAENENEEGEGLWEDNNMVVERVLSVHNPMAKIVNKSGTLTNNRIQQAITGAGKKISYHGKTLWWVFGYPAGIWQNQDYGKNIDIPVTIIPAYLQDEINGGSLKMTADVNGNLSGTFGSGDEGDSWSFTGVNFPKNKAGDTSTFGVRTIRYFTDDYKKALKKSFGVNPVDELSDEQRIYVKAITPEDYQITTGNTVRQSAKAKTKLFFASTVANAPQYIILSLRMAIVFVLVAMISFGMVYGIGLKNTKIKE